MSNYINPQKQDQKVFNNLGMKARGFENTRNKNLILPVDIWNNYCMFVNRKRNPQTNEKHFWHKIGFCS